MFLAWCAMDEGHWKLACRAGMELQPEYIANRRSGVPPSDGRAVRVVQQPRGKWHFIDSVPTSCSEHSFTDIACASKSPL